MKTVELMHVLQEFYRDKLTTYNRHVAAARQVSDYEFNNTYQYVIAREDVQLAWLRDAILDLGGTPDDAVQLETAPSGRGEADVQRSVFARDSDEAERFVDKWRPRLDAVTHARHRNMLRVILGETLEHKRFFDQALAGRTDLLGRRADGAGTGGGVLPTRWVE